MHQQINFYRAEFRREQSIFGANSLVISCVAIVLALLASWLFAAQSVTGLENEFQIISRQEQAALQRLEDIQPIVGDLSQQQAWSQRLDDATRALQEKQLVLSLVQGSTLGDTRGFARHMRSLSRNDTDELWLTRISLSALGDRNQLRGKALRAELVASYLQRLAEEAPFSKQRFNQFRIIGPDDGNGAITFSMNSDSRLLAESAGTP